MIYRPALHFLIDCHNLNRPLDGVARDATTEGGCLRTVGPFVERHGALYVRHCDAQDANSRVTPDRRGDLVRGLSGGLEAGEAAQPPTATHNLFSPVADICSYV